MEELIAMVNKDFKCGCEFCVAHDKYKWAVVMSCGCGCHNDDGMCGHEALCCEIPNGLQKNNPYPELVDKELCKNIILEFNQKWHTDGL